MPTFNESTNPCDAGTMPVTTTVFPNKLAQRKIETTQPSGEFAQALREPAILHSSKEALPLVGGYTFGNKRTERNCLRHGDNVLKVTMLIGDYDAMEVSPEEAVNRLRKAGVRGWIVTSARHKSDAPKWRVLVPLSVHYDPCEFVRLMALLNGALGGILAPESFTFSQSFHIGRVAGAEYEVHESKGEPMDLLDLFIEPIYKDGTGTPPAPAVHYEESFEPVDASTMHDIRTAVLSLSPARFGKDSHDHWIGVLFALKHLSACGQVAEAESLWLDMNERHGSDEKKRTAASKWNAERAKPRSHYRALFTMAQEDNPKPADSLEGFDSADAPAAQSDLEISRRVAALAHERGFVCERKGRGWMQYVKGCYRVCKLGEEVELAKEIGPAILREASAGDADDISRIMALAKRAMSNNGIKAALDLAQSDPLVVVASGDFDSDPDYLNVLNGVVHLPSGALIPHDPSQRLSRQIQVEYHPDAPAPIWYRFLADISLNDPDWVDFLHRAFGYAIGGRPKEEILLFLLGSGANGKSVLSNAITRVFGPYVAHVPSNFFMTSKRDGEAASPALASLPGARLVFANEVESGSHFSAQAIKVATSTDTIATRHNYGSLFTFVPTHVPIVRGNHKPIITDNDEGVWRRVRLIPFDRHFTPEEKDTDLERKIMTEAPGVLAWLIAGHLAYRKHGIRPSRRVLAASAAYRADSDVLGQWLEERVTQAQGAQWRQDEAYFDYRDWCAQNGLSAMAKKSLTRSLQERRIKVGQESGGGRKRTYLHIKSARNCGFDDPPFTDAAQDEQDLCLFQESLP